MYELWGECTSTSIISNTPITPCTLCVLTDLSVGYYSAAFDFYTVFPRSHSNVISMRTLRLAE